MVDLKTKVLVVDDMLTMRKLIISILKEIGFTQITEAEDGAVAWTKANETKEPFGLIICDWNMPNANGLDVLTKVRADARYKNVPFVMVTAELEPHQVAQANKLGISGHVAKPFTNETFKIKLKELKVIA